MQIILASQSPRRKELLSMMGVAFDVVPSAYDERLDDSRLSEEVAIELALGKANEVAERYPEACVIGSDTIVEVNGKQLEKPRDADDAIKMLTMLSDKPSYVMTGVAVVCREQNITLTGCETTKVVFRPHNEGAIVAYVATGDPLDKAGAYGIQSGAAPLIDHIEGRYDTVVGLPTGLLSSFLSKVGVSSQPVQLEAPILVINRT